MLCLLIDVQETCVILAGIEPATFRYEFTLPIEPTTSHQVILYTILITDIVQRARFDLHLLLLPDKGFKHLSAIQELILTTQNVIISVVHCPPPLYHIHNVLSADGERRSTEKTALMRYCSLFAFPRQHSIVVNVLKYRVY